MEGQLSEEECLEIKKGMYGLVQASRLYFLKFTKYMKELGFQQCPSEQCLFFKWGKRSMLILATYVDDSIIFGQREDINDFFESIELFKIKHENELNNFLGVNIIRSKEKDRVWLLQPHLIKSLMQEWGEKLKDKRCPATPGTPNQSFKKVLKEVKEGLVPISKEEHKIYQSMVGEILYLLKHSEQLC